MSKRRWRSEQQRSAPTSSGQASTGWDGTTGIGVGIAIVDSGIGSHPDLQDRVVVSVDFVDPDGDGDDGYGHGTHVAGIAAGGGAAAGVAPAAHLINLRVLNDEGWGHASTVIEAIDWAIANQDRYAIRVLNLSLGAGVATSYQDDPLGQAVERAVAAGIVVVCSAGNYGKTEEGTPIIGGITSPGNTPSALTVGALNTFDTPVRSDDAVTSYSSRGPTAFDYVLKPDLVAPGNKVVSLEAPLSYLSVTYPERQVPGGYLQLSGTSMSAAMVSGAAALLLGSNPDLSPQQVKIALQASASPIAGAGLVEAGAGSVNVVAALYVAVHGPTAELPTISIGGEQVDIGGLVFFSRLVPVDQLAEANISSLAQLQDLVLRHNVALRLRNTSAGSATLSFSEGSHTQAILWTNRFVSSDAILWTNSTVSSDAILWTNSTVSSDAILWTNSTVSSDAILWTNSTVSSDAILWTNSTTPFSGPTAPSPATPFSGPTAPFQRRHSLDQQHRLQRRHSLDQQHRLQRRHSLDQQHRLQRRHSLDQR